MRPGRAADHSPPSGAAVMEELSYNSTRPLGHTGPVTGTIYLYSLHTNIRAANTKFWFSIHTWMSATLDIFLTSAPNGREWSNSYIKCFIAKETLRGILRRICRLGPRAGLYTNKSLPLPEMVQPTARPKNTCAIRAHIDLIWCHSIVHGRSIRIRQ